VDVKDILLQEELVDDYLRPWIAEIEQIKDPLTCHALWWALENRVAMDQLRDYPHHFVYYEKALLNPRKTVDGLYAWLGVDGIDSRKSTELFTKPSRMVQKDEPYQKNIERLSWWKEKFPEESQKNVLLWASRLGVVNYNEELLPLDFEKFSLSGIV
jgi:hypothetical protein